MTCLALASVVAVTLWGQSELVEGGPSEAVTQQPAHPYSQLLIDAAPDPGRSTRRAGTGDGGRGEPPSLIAPPPGCRFHPRCPHAMDVCTKVPPPATEVGEGHWSRCWLHVPSSQPVALRR